MLLPDKHITLAESMLGLGAFVLALLDRPRTVDHLYQRVKEARDDRSLPAYHDLDSVLLALRSCTRLVQLRRQTRGVSPMRCLKLSTPSFRRLLQPERHVVRGRRERAAKTTPLGIGRRRTTASVSR